MLPCSPVQASERKKYRAWQKNRIRKSNKIREGTVKDKSHHAALDRVHIQITSVQKEKSSIAHHATLKRVCIQSISIQAEE